MTLAARLAKAEKALAKAQAESTKASEARFALPAGSSRARVTTANARWMSKSEHRDRCAREVEEARAALAAEGSEA